MKIFGAIQEALKWFNSSERKRIKSKIIAGRRYIRCNEKEGKYKDLSPQKRKKYLTHYRKQFFAY